MQVPKRRSEAAVKRESGPFLVTAEGLERLHKTLLRLQGELPEMISEVERTKAHGDFSENAAYQDAKHTLRRTYGRIDNIKDRIKRAEIIVQGPNTTGKVQIGSTVVLDTKGKRVTFEILGHHEANPSSGRISDQSPLGQALLGHAVGETVEIPVRLSRISYRILEIK